MAKSLKIVRVGREEFAELAAQIREAGEPNEQGGHKLGRAYLTSGGKRIYAGDACLIADRAEAEAVAVEEKFLQALQAISLLVGTKIDKSA